MNRSYAGSSAERDLNSPTIDEKPVASGRFIAARILRSLAPRCNMSIPESSTVECQACCRPYGFRRSGSPLRAGDSRHLLRRT